MFKIKTFSKTLSAIKQLSAEMFVLRAFLNQMLHLLAKRNVFDTKIFEFKSLYGTCN
jgi:hypothetical protein